jgi:hypothetical protein
LYSLPCHRAKGHWREVQVCFLPKSK